jgi:excisionase family DNA binding protein
VDTAAKYLCTTRYAIYHRIDHLQLPFIRDGRRVRFDRHAIDRWMKKREKHGLGKRGGIWCFRKMINGRLFRESTGFADNGKNVHSAQVRGKPRCADRRQFLPHFGARMLDEITKSDIVRYLNLRRTQMTGNPGHKNCHLVSESTVRRERGLLQSIFERAIDESYDIRNPFRGIKRGKDEPRTRVLALD